MSSYFDKIAATDDFAHAAQIRRQNPDIWAITVRNERTIALFEYMTQLLAEKDDLYDIIEPSLYDGIGEPEFYRHINREMASMGAPFKQAHYDPPLFTKIAGQNWHDKDKYIGSYHKDHTPWALLLSTVPTTRTVLQKHVPGVELNGLCEIDELLLHDPETVSFDVTPGTALVLNGLRNQISVSTPFHMVRRCKRGQKRLCALAHP